MLNETLLNKQYKKNNVKTLRRGMLINNAETIK